MWRVFNQQSTIKNQQLLQVCEEAERLPPWQIVLASSRRSWK
jgi:hypothetical protein